MSEIKNSPWKNFSTDVLQDYIGKKKYWQGVPDIPNVNLDKIIQHVNRISKHVNKNPIKYKKEHKYLTTINVTKDNYIIE